MFLLVLVNFVFAQDPNLVFKNNKGAAMLQDEDKVFDAKDYLQKNVVNNPDSPELKYNLGHALEQGKENEKAIQQYSEAAKTARGDLQFQAFFNAARLYGEARDYSNALKNYQMALEIKPDSQEVKTNIELLLKSDGGGGNSSQKQNDKQDQNKDQQKQQDQQQDQKENPHQQQDKKKQPKPFRSQELSNQDVKRILEELKRQEEQIRAKMLNKKSREQNVEKDW